MKEISIEITHDCALKCIFCSSSAEHPSPLGELSLQKVKEIIDDAIYCGAELVSISGGEPLLHKDILNILSYCEACGLEVYLYSSGVVFDDNDHRKSVEKDFWSVLYSLLGKKLTVIFDVQACYKQAVEYLNDVKDSFELIIESIKNAKTVGINCEIHIVPMKQNYKEIPQILYFCKNIGISRVSFLRFVPQGRGIENKELLNLSDEEFYELQIILYNGVKKYGKDFIRLGHPIDFLFCVDGNCEISSCRGGTDAPLVLPNGDVHMCPAWKQLKHLRAGNIFENSLREIWNNSEFYVKFRELVNNTDLIRGLCKNCDYLQQCKGGCTAQRILLFDKLNLDFPDVMYLSPDPYCPLVNNYEIKKKLKNGDKDSVILKADIPLIIISMIKLHNKKSIMYGDAWKKRGEILSIFSNISRKYDRIENVKGTANFSDGESLFDTLADLCIYCVKYITYIAEKSGNSMTDFLKEENFNVVDVKQYLNDSGVSNFFYGIKNNIEKVEKCQYKLDEYLNNITTHYAALETCVLDKGAGFQDSYFVKIKECYGLVINCIMAMEAIAIEMPGQFYDFIQMVNE